ncbi:hypothetical protein [Streptomyces sp. NPDC004682]
MIDMQSQGVVLEKRTHRKIYTLGKSAALSDVEIAQMDNGAIRVIAYRRPEFWDYNPKTPLAVSWVYRIGGTYEDAIAWVRERESPFITHETSIITVQR